MKSPEMTGCLAIKVFLYKQLQNIHNKQFVFQCSDSLLLMDNTFSSFTDEPMLLYEKMYGCSVNMLLVWAELCAHKCAPFNFPTEKHGFNRKEGEVPITFTSPVEQVLLCHNVC